MYGTLNAIFADMNNLLQLLTGVLYISLSVLYVFHYGMNAAWGWHHSFFNLIMVLLVFRGIADIIVAARKLLKK